MEKNSSFDSPLLLFLIIVSVIFFIGIPQKIEYTLEGKVYSIYCKYVEKQSQEFCDAFDIATKRINTFKPSKEDDILLKYLHNKLLIPVLIINATLFILLYPRFKKKKSNQALKKSVPKLFDGQLQKAVENVYSIGIAFSDKEIKLLKSVENPYVRLALLMLLAKDKSNFAGGEVANGITDETARKVIFSAGRPAIPPSVFPFYLMAERVFSEYQNHLRSNQ